ncbi:helix-turn-helix transcriptional regulator [Pandoraea sp. NPDC087047]|uniref:helix-turn-helix transcriptional regulator n=1 Tax=Pandoraea sp. NPDC087047 TaxID=3364390 RepID=UPI0038003B75
MSDDVSYRRASDAVQAVGEGHADWLDVVQTAREFLGADAATFLCHDKQSRSVRFVEQSGHEARLIDEYARYFYQYDDSTRRFWDAPAGTWYDSSVALKHESPNDRVFWNEFMRPYQLQQLVGVVISNDNDALTALSIQRMHIVEPNFAHAARVAEYERQLAAAFAARRAATRASLNALSQMLDPSREGFLIASPDGWVLEFANGLDTLLASHDSQLTLRQRHLIHRQPEWQTRLQKALGQVSRGGDAMSLVVPDSWGHAFRLTLRALGTHMNHGLRAAVGVRIERRSIFNVPGETALRQHFALTQAEARLFHHLVAGLTIGECSEVLSLSTSTLRTQLSAILRKTGCHRQGELLRLAALLAP